MGKRHAPAMLSIGAHTASQGLFCLSARYPAIGWPKRFVSPKTAFRIPAWLKDIDMELTSIGIIVGKDVECMSFIK
jgi:hypothetical protein